MAEPVTRYMIFNRDGITVIIRNPVPDLPSAEPDPEPLVTMIQANIPDEQPTPPKRKRRKKK